MSVEWRVRKAVRVPIVHYRRWRSDHEGYDRLVLEAIAYRRSIYRFAYAVKHDPDFRNRYPLTAESVVVDGGAYDGAWALEMADRYGCRVHGFEPVPTIHAKLVAAVADRPNVTAWPVGLGAADGEVVLTMLGPGSTAEATPYSGPRETGRIRDAAAALDELGVEEIDLLKLNIEGAEYDVLDRLADAGWLPRIRYLQIQFHDTRPDAFARRRRNRRALRKTHDQEWNYDWVFESWKRRS